MTIELIRDERLRLVERLEAMSEDDWMRPSLCAGWKVKDVVAHLVMPFTVSTPALAITVIKKRSVSRAMDEKARWIASRNSPAELVALLRKNASTEFTPPGMPLEAPLVDIVAHSADIRWVVDEPTVDWANPERMQPILNFLVTPKGQRAFVSRGRLDGLRFVATDLDWVHGTGADVSGTGLQLTMGMLGRPSAIPALQGPGVEQLRRHIGS